MKGPIYIEVPADRVCVEGNENDVLQTFGYYLQFDEGALPVKVFFEDEQIIFYFNLRAAEWLSVNVMDWFDGLFIDLSWI